MKPDAGLIPLATFFMFHPEWYQAIKETPSYFNDTVSYDPELWEDICEYFYQRRPQGKADSLWDKVLLEDQMLRKFSKLKKTRFFNAKAP